MLFHDLTIFTHGQTVALQQLISQTAHVRLKVSQRGYCFDVAVKIYSGVAVLGHPSAGLVGARIVYPHVKPRTATKILF